MRAAVVNAAHGFDIVEVPDPAPGPAELVLRVGACGICGSDLKAVERMRVGLVMGHEFCGEVVAAGRDVASAWPIGAARHRPPPHRLRHVLGVPLRRRRPLLVG